MTDQQDDKEFAAFLAGESEWADHYQELGCEQPPAELDERILAAASAAVKVRWLEFGSRGGWLKPVALAATVLLSFSLVMKIGIDSPVRYEQVVTASEESDQSLEGSSEPVVHSLLDRTSPPRQAAMEHMRNEQLAEKTANGGKALVRLEPLEQQDAPLANSELVPAEQSIDQDAALLIVVEHVAAAKAQSDSGRVRMLEMRAHDEYKAGQPELSASNPTVADKDVDSIDTLQREDNSGSMLREIVWLYTSGSGDEAGIRLDEFLARYPDHPVSVRLRQRGY